MRKGVISPVTILHRHDTKFVLALNAHHRDCAQRANTRGAIVLPRKLWLSRQITQAGTLIGNFAPTEYNDLATAQ
jgi:hypothetical protein